MIQFQSSANNISLDRRVQDIKSKRIGIVVEQIHTKQEYLLFGVLMEDNGKIERFSFKSLLEITDIVGKKILSISFSNKKVLLTTENHVFSIETKDGGIGEESFITSVEGISNIEGQIVKAVYRSSYVNLNSVIEMYIESELGIFTIKMKYKTYDEDFGGGCFIINKNKKLSC
jgi:hypothetical protein